MQTDKRVDYLASEDAQWPNLDLVLPDQGALTRARGFIHSQLTEYGIGSTALEKHLKDEVTPGLNQSSLSSRYYGFVTGGATAAARAADSVVTEYDQNVAVHLPDESLATDVEHHALDMLCELLDFVPGQWSHRTFTTGATASNIVGLACGRERVIAEAGKRLGKTVSVAEHGLVDAMRIAGLEHIQILTTVPHSSIRKAASVLGLGHSAVVELARPEQANKFDLDRLVEALQKPRTASLIMVSCAEVNTGLFATEGDQELKQLRVLADQHGAWIHVDAAFGLLCRALPNTDEFQKLVGGVAGLEMADSITGDAHKLINVPYDCGFILSKHLDTASQVFQNPGAVYLSAPTSSIPSPLNIGIENSRRFRALPVYANLVAYGRAGFSNMLQRQIRLARRIATFMMEHDAYELLPISGISKEERLQDVFIIVLFRAKDNSLNAELKKRINATRTIYCSGTSWEGLPATRFAISNWKAEITRDWPVVKEVLREVATSA